MTVDLQKALVLLHVATKNVDRSMLEMCLFPTYPPPGLPSLIQNVEVFSDFRFEFADVPIDFSREGLQQQKL